MWVHRKCSVFIYKYLNFSEALQHSTSGIRLLSPLLWTLTVQKLSTGSLHLLLCFVGRGSYVHDQRDHRSWVGKFVRTAVDLCHVHCRKHCAMP
jgi:hypothetical protein